MMDFVNNNFVIISSFLVILAGIILFGIQLDYLSKSLKTKDWMETIGIITKSEVENNKDPGDAMHGYRPLIIYSYKINGIELESRKVYFGDDIYISNKWKVEKFVEKFPIWRELVVYVNPSNQNESVLIKGVRISNVIYLSLCTLMIGIGIAGLIYNKNIYDFLMILKSN